MYRENHQPYQNGHPTGEKNGMTRRDFLKKAGEAALVVLGSPLLARGETKKDAKNEKEYQALRNCEAQIQSYLEQKTILSEKEIKEELRRCRFLNDKEIKIQHLEIKNPGSMLSDRDALKESLEEALRSGQIQFDLNNFNVIQTDFEKCAISPLAAAFYDHKYRAIFVDQEKDNREKRKDLEEVIYRAAVGEEYGRRLQQLENLSRSQSSLEEPTEYLHTAEGRKKQEELYQWFDATKTPKNLREIAPLIAQYEKEVFKEIQNFRMQEAADYFFAQNILPHEAFHYFFENQLGREGYSGPNMAEILAVAIKGKRQRFGQEDLQYGVPNDIEPYLTKIDVADEAQLSQFCGEITQKYNLTSFPPEHSLEEWRSFSDEERNKIWEWKNFSNFLNEHLARVYSGMLGNTPKHAKYSLEKIYARFGGKSPAYKFEESYHEPTIDDIAMFQKMKWNGKSLVK